MDYEIRWLRGYVNQCVQETFGGLAEVDADADLAFRWGTAACFVSCADSGFPVVRVWAIAVTGVRSSAKLLREINDCNARTRTAHVYFGDTPYPADADDVDAHDEAA